MTEVWLLARRAVREVWRLPAATLPTLFIPLFFLAVNIGQVSKTFPRTVPFLHGQPYVAFQLPVSLIFAVSTATSGLALVTDIDIGYFDKLLAAPIRRSSIVLGRLAADLLRGVLGATIVLLAGIAFGARPVTGPAGDLLLVVLTAAWGVAYAGISITIALRTKNVQATNASFVVFFPLLFLTPNFVPISLLSAPLNTIARFNPVTYVIEGLRSLVLTGYHPGSLLACVGVILGVGVSLTASSLHAIHHFAD